MDTNENNVDMDLLVDNNPDPREDYLDEHNKEVVEQNPDPDKVVEADLEMDPAAATESFIRKNFGLSVEEMEEEAEEMEASAEEIIENSEPVTDEDSILGIEPADPEATTVVVTPPEGGETTVVEGEGENEVVETKTLDVEPDSAAGVASLENLRAIFSREDDETDAMDDDDSSADVSLNVQTPNNDVDIDLEGKAVTIEPNEDGESHSEPDGDEGSVEAPETSSDDETTDEDKTESENNDEEDSDSSAESWWMI